MLGDEWRGFFDEAIANKNESVKGKICKIQDQNAQVFRWEGESIKNIRLIDKVNLSRNSLQVINQYAIGPDQGALYDNCYDVTILVTGLPLVHVELKWLGGQLKEAFNQIVRYQHESFGQGRGFTDGCRFSSYQTAPTQSTTRPHDRRPARGQREGVSSRRFWPTQTMTR